METDRDLVIRKNRTGSPRYAERSGRVGYGNGLRPSNSKAGICVSVEENGISAVRRKAKQSGYIERELKGPV